MRSVAWLALLWVGCDDYEPRRPPALEHTFELDEDDGQVADWVCGQPDVRAPIRLALEDGDEPGQIRELTRDDSLRIVVHNDAPVDAVAVLRARSVSKAGFRELDVGRIDVAAHESATVSLDADGLGLPSGTFDFSGGLTIDAFLSFENGQVTDSTMLELHFHPVDSGWTVYDTAALQDDFAGGVLTAGARQRMAAAQDLAQERERADAAESVSIEAVDSFGPEGVQR